MATADVSDVLSTIITLIQTFLSIKQEENILPYLFKPETLCF